MITMFFQLFYFSARKEEKMMMMMKSSGLALAFIAILVCLAAATAVRIDYITGSVLYVAKLLSDRVIVLANGL